VINTTVGLPFHGTAFPTELLKNRKRQNASCGGLDGTKSNFTEKTGKIVKIRECVQSIFRAISALSVGLRLQSGLY
jgi:hypothetical protein